MSERIDRLCAAMRDLGPATSRDIIAAAQMAPEHAWPSLGWLVQTNRATVTKSGNRKLYSLREVKDERRQQSYQTPPVVLSGTAASRARLLDPSVSGRITERTTYTRCPSSPVYSNVQCLPNEKVPAVFRGVPGLDPMTGRPWA